MQIFAGKGVGGDGSVGDVPWDCHTNVETNHKSCGKHVDQPAAALLTDLAAKGLLESTLVIWGGEFGRTSDSQGAKGRDHNPNGFTIWLAGAGVKGGFHYGATDEFGYKAVQNKVHVNDLHATLLQSHGTRSHQTHLSLQRPRLSPHRRSRRSCKRDPHLTGAHSYSSSILLWKTPGRNKSARRPQAKHHGCRWYSAIIASSGSSSAVMPHMSYKVCSYGF